MLPYLLAAAIAAVAAASELVARYKDSPRKALFTIPAVAYIALNVSGALAAYYLVAEIFPQDFGFAEAQSVQIQAMRILVAGLGALAFFRSALFNVRVGDADIGVGPAGILQIFLGATDRAVDRARAAPRALFVNTTMAKVDFDKAVISLPPFCFQLMQNVSAEEQEQFGVSIRALQASNIDPKVKSLILGLSLVNIVGEAVLRAAVETLDTAIM